MAPGLSGDEFEERAHKKMRHCPWPEKSPWSPKVHVILFADHCPRVVFAALHLVNWLQ